MSKTAILDQEVAALASLPDAKVARWRRAGLGPLGPAKLAVDQLAAHYVEKVVPHAVQGRSLDEVAVLCALDGTTCTGLVEAVRRLAELEPCYCDRPDPAPGTVEGAELVDGLVREVVQRHEQPVGLMLANSRANDYRPVLGDGMTDEARVEGVLSDVIGFATGDPREPDTGDLAAVLNVNELGAQWVVTMLGRLSGTGGPVKLASEWVAHVSPDELAQWIRTAAVMLRCGGWSEPSPRMLAGAAASQGATWVTVMATLGGFLEGMAAKLGASDTDRAELSGLVDMMTSPVMLAEVAASLGVPQPLPR